MRTAKLGDVCEFKPSKRLARIGLSEDDPVSFVPMSDLGIHQKYLTARDERPLCEVAGSYTYFAEGDVLLAKITPCFENGKLGIARGLTNGVGFGSSEFTVIRPGAEVLPEYVYYFLDHDDVRERGEKVMTGAVGHKRVPQEFIEALEIPLPPLEEQRRIVAVLDEAFAAIATATANAEKNLANARELFNSMFNGLFSRGDDWEERSISELVTLGILDRPLDGNHGAIHPTKSEFVRSGVPFIMASDLDSGTVDLDGCYFITSERAKTLKKGFAKNGDVLISHKGTIGRVSLLKTELDCVVLTPQVTYYRVRRPESISREFLFLALQEPNFQNEMKRIAGAGSTRAYIGITAQLDLRVRFPKPERQAAVVMSLTELSDRIENLRTGYDARLLALRRLKATRPSRSRKKRTAQICFCVSGRLVPTVLPAFHAGRICIAGSNCECPIVLLLGPHWPSKKRGDLDQLASTRIGS